MSNPHVDKTKMFEMSRSVSIVMADAKGHPHAIRADETGNLPKSIEVLHVGAWRTPYHGDIMITADDLQEYVTNFDNGVARADNGRLGLPINFAHESWQKAAGWMTRLYVSGDSLMADVEWTNAGKEGLLGGEWKCFSPEFCPAGRGGWCDPLDKDRIIDNVLEGGALTNIPLYRDQKPIMASASFGQDRSKPNVFLVTASQINEGETMTLAEVVAKDNATLTEEERNFLVEHKDELSAEDKTKFGFETEVTTTATGDTADENKDNDNNGGDTVSQTTETTAPAVDPELASVAADIKSGKSVVINADRLARLENTASQYETEKAEATVKAHIARGAIKADQLGAWTKKLVQASAEERAEFESMLDGLNGSEVMADTKGSDTNSADATGDAYQEVKTKAEKVIADAREKGEVVDFGTAVSRVFASDSALQERYNEELNG